MKKLRKKIKYLSAVFIVLTSIMITIGLSYADEPMIAEEEKSEIVLQTNTDFPDISEVVHHETQEDSSVPLQNVEELLNKAKHQEKLNQELVMAVDDNQAEINPLQVLRQNIVGEAARWVGVTPYVWAGRSLIGGTDCSGFTNLIYGLYGISLPTGSDVYQTSVGFHVSYEELQPGDIVVYRNGGHVAIYVGNNTIIHCSTPESGTIYSDLFCMEPTAFVNVIDA